jgi:hypothetical protein
VSSAVGPSTSSKVRSAAEQPWMSPIAMVRLAM